MHPITHLELHTGDLAPARDFYSELFGWSAHRIEVGGKAYQALDSGDGIGCGVVECGSPRPLWLPYVEVAEIASVTERARRLGGSLLLGPREGPAGWRSVVSAPAGGEVALWQPKR